MYGGKIYAFYKEFSAISEQEAYEKICRGEFSGGYQGMLKVDVKKCRIVYVVDTKGYYQPVYDFTCEIDGEEREILIPAIE